MNGSYRKNSVVFYLNNKLINETKIDVTENLLHYLRDPKIGLKGAKESCGDGICGSCTVMIAQYDHIINNIRVYAINSCKFPLIYCHGTAIYTIEGFYSSISPIKILKNLICTFSKKSFIYCFLLYRR